MFHAPKDIEKPVSAHKQSSCIGADEQIANPPEVVQEEGECGARYDEHAAKGKKLRIKYRKLDFRIPQRPLGKNETLC